MPDQTNPKRRRSVARRDAKERGDVIAEGTRLPCLSTESRRSGILTPQAPSHSEAKHGGTKVWRRTDLIAFANDVTRPDSP